MISVNIRPLVIDGKHFVDVVMDGKTTRRPAASADEAEATASRFAATLQGSQLVGAFRRRAGSTCSIMEIRPWAM
jgi:hypothetical protein